MKRVLIAVIAACLAAGCDAKPAPKPEIPAVTLPKVVIPDADNPALQPLGSPAARKVEQACIKDGVLPVGECACYAQALDKMLSPQGMAFMSAEDEKTGRGLLAAMPFDQVTKLYDQIDDAKAQCKKPS